MVLITLHEQSGFPQLKKLSWAKRLRSAGVPGSSKSSKIRMEHQHCSTHT